MPQRQYLFPRGLNINLTSIIFCRKIWIARRNKIFGTVLKILDHHRGRSLQVFKEFVGIFHTFFFLESVTTCPNHRAMLEGRIIHITGIPSRWCKMIFRFSKAPALDVNLIILNFKNGFTVAFHKAFYYSNDRQFYLNGGINLKKRSWPEWMDEWNQ